MRESHQRWIPLLGKIADRADSIALRFFRSPTLAVAKKGDRSPVSEADRSIEEVAREIARRDEPSLGFLGEESGEEQGAGEARIICDPIDGTENFVSGIPIFATLLGIEERGEIVAGLVSAPALCLRWQASRGNGARCGDRRLYVSRVATIAAAQVFHSDLSFDGDFLRPRGFALLLARARRSRGFGDFYQHLLVAEGAGEIAFDPVVKPWDVSPLQVIVEEAGGRATTIEGERTIYGGRLVTSTGLLHEEALRILRNG